MLIYFEKEHVLISTTEILSVEYVEENSIPCLHFTGGSKSRHDYVDIIFKYKEEALSTLHFIAYEYSKNPRQILTIHTDK